MTRRFGLGEGAWSLPGALEGAVLSAWTQEPEEWSDQLVLRGDTGVGDTRLGFPEINGDEVTVYAQRSPFDCRAL